MRSANIRQSWFKQKQSTDGAQTLGYCSWLQFLTMPFLIAPNETVQQLQIGTAWNEVTQSPCYFDTPVATVAWYVSTYRKYHTYARMICMVSNGCRCAKHPHRHREKALTLTSQAWCTAFCASLGQLILDFCLPKVQPDILGIEVDIGLHWNIKHP